MRRFLKIEKGLKVMAMQLTTVLDKSLKWALMHSAEAECSAVAWPLTVTFYLTEILSLCLRFCLEAVSASYLSDWFLSFQLLLTSGRLRLLLIMVYYKVLSRRLYCCCTSCIFSTFWQRLKALFVSFKPQDVSERQILHSCLDSVKGWSADSSSQIEEQKTTFRMWPWEIFP